MSDKTLLDEFALVAFKKLNLYRMDKGDIAAFCYELADAMMNERVKYISKKSIESANLTDDFLCSFEPESIAQAIERAESIYAWTLLTPQDLEVLVIASKLYLKGTKQ